jgi:hypothetical protein
MPNDTERLVTLFFRGQIAQQVIGACGGGGGWLQGQMLASGLVQGWCMQCRQTSELTRQWSRGYAVIIIPYIEEFCISKLESTGVDY